MLDETLGALTFGDRNAEVIEYLVRSIQSLGYQVSISRALATETTLTKIPRIPSRIEQIQKAVCEQEGVNIAQMLSPQRAAQFTRPRHMAIWLSTECTTASLPLIGRVFNRDHTTIINARKRFPVLMAADADLERRALALRETFNQPSIICEGVRI